MNGVTTPQSSQIGGALARPKQLQVSMVDNGFVVADFNGYPSPLQKVALDFDSMVSILKEFFG